MKVIFVAPKANLPLELIKKLEENAEIEFYEDSPIDIRTISVLKEPGDKILCPFPEPMAWNFPSDYIKEIPDLKGICLSTTSFSWVDSALTRAINIPLTNVPNPPNAVAEAAIFAMFGVARRFAETLKTGKFEYKPENLLLEVTNKTMGVIGLGKIGSRVAELGKNLGLKVVYWSRNSRNKDYEYLELEELFKTVDFIFPVLVQNEETRGLVSKKLIDLMKPTTSIIATLNEDTIDMEYLFEKVKNREIYGCAIGDAETNSMNYEGNVFVIFTNNWYTKETLAEKMRIWVESIISVINNNPINVVN